MSVRTQLFRAAGALFALCLAANSMARTGGGSHAAAASHAAGSHAGSSSGSSGSGGSLGGVIVLLIIVIGAVYIMRRLRSGSAGQPVGQAPQAQAAMAALGSVIGASNLARIAIGDLGPGAAAAPRRALPAAIDAIRAADPGFEMETFLQRAEMTFFLVKRGVQKNDAAAIRPLFERCGVQRRVRKASRNPKPSIGMRCWRVSMFADSRSKVRSATLKAKAFKFISTWCIAPRP